VKYKLDEIVEIVTETLEETAKDLLNLEDRRPAIHLTIKSMYALLKCIEADEIEETLMARGFENTHQIIAETSFCKLQK